MDKTLIAPTKRAFYELWDVFCNILCELCKNTHPIFDRLEAIEWERLKKHPRFVWTPFSFSQKLPAAARELFP